MAHEDIELTIKPHTPAQACLPASNKEEQRASEEVRFMHIYRHMAKLCMDGIICTDIQALSVEVQFFLCPES